jgi:type VI secretion system secreted protein VgrG
VPDRNEDTRDADQGAYLGIKTPLGSDAVTLINLEGEDVLSRCFLYRVTVVTMQTGDAIESLLGQPVTLWLMNTDSERRRPINGHVRRVVALGPSLRGAQQYRLEIVPRLWFLSCTSDCRIFQHQNVPDILQTVFRDQGLTNVEFRINQSDYPALEYCVQYQETALDFVSRLMEHLGLFYWHEHDAGKHQLVIADRNMATDKCSPYSLRITPDNIWGELRSLAIDSAFRPGKWTLNDYDFESPTKLLLVDTPTLANVPRMADHEIYEYPGNFQDPDAGRQLTRLRVEMEEAQYRRVFGSGSCAGFDPGRRFAVEDRAGGMDKAYLLTQVRHRASWAGYEAGNGEDCRYENDYVAIPATVPFRPERSTPRPFVRGTQTATVVGPAGENIYCDAYGRVRVQFHWDRRGRRNENSSCWMRVAQARSGAHYGTLVIPHVGHEVLISFIEGDPDRPLITGTVPNALTMPPVNLPDDKHKTVQRDHGDNKIVMHGKAGKEHLSMSSPRAVNLFASGKAARPLSAAASTVIVAPPSAASGSLTFYANPSQNNGSANATNPAPDDQPGSGSSFQIPVFQDGVGLRELWQEWYGTTQSDAAVSAYYATDADGKAVTPDAGTYGVQDGTVGDSYLNWGSEGRINCLTLGNNNNWVYGNANTWVNGTVNAQINGDSVTTINGKSTTTIGGDSTTVIGTPSDNSVSTTTVWGPSNTRIGGANASTVLGDNTSSVLGSNQSFTVGYNLAIVGGINTSINLFGLFENSLWKITTDGLKFYTAETKLVDLGTELNNKITSIDNKITAIENAEASLHDNVVTIHL